MAGVETTYLLDTAAPLTMILAETTGSETIHYLHGLDLVAESDGAASDYFLYDGLGSARQLTDPAGEVLLAQTFDPYGNLYASAGAGQSSFGYTGEYQDASGLLYLRARYYDPARGRFFQPDPFSGIQTMPMSLNPYIYGLNNPLLYTDPSGEIAPLVIIIVGGAVIGIVAGVSWEVYVNQGYAVAVPSFRQFPEALGTVFSPSHYCGVDWFRTVPYGATGGFVGALSAPIIEAYLPLIVRLGGDLLVKELMRVGVDNLLPPDYVREMRRLGLDPGEMASQAAKYGVSPSDLLARARSEGVRPDDYLIGYDADRDQFDIRELQQARQIETEFGVQLRRKYPDEGGNFDWAGSDGNYYDAMGGLPPEAAARPEQRAQLIGALYDHLVAKHGPNGEDVVIVVDFGGMTGEQKEALRRYISGLPADERNRIKIINE